MSAIALSLLPLLLILLLSIPEAILQREASINTAQVHNTSFAAAAVRDTEDARLAALIALRRMTYHEPQAAAEYATAIGKWRLSLSRLDPMTGQTPAVIAAGRQVHSTGTVLLEMSEAIDEQIRQGDLASAAAIMSGRAYYDRVEKLQNAVAAFVASSRFSQSDQFTALERLWKTSILLFLIAVAGLAISSALLLSYSGRIVRGILELRRKSEAFQRGETLGSRWPHNDEIGLLDAALHESVAASDLRESQLQRYRLLADVTQNIILFVDRTDLTIVDANAAALAGYGYERHDLVGKPNAILHSVDHPIDAEAIALSDTSAGLSYEGMHQRSDGTTFPVEVHARTAEVNGRRTIIKTIRDITERTRAERALRDSNALLAKYALLVENTRDFFLIIDRKTYRILDVNNAALDAWGYTRDEFLQLTTYDIRASDQKVGTEENLARAEKEGIPVESLCVRKDRTTFPVEFTARNVILDGRSVLLVVSRDISERKQSNLELSKALQQAVEATELKSSFVATVSHEIRTPLNGIIGMSELLLRSQLDSDQRECAQTMHDSSLALLRIINDILDFSKLEAGQAQLDNIEFQIAPLVEGVIEVVSRSSRRESLTMMAYVSPKVPPVLRGDPGRLRQILFNLVGNAAKFTSVGSVLLQVELEASPGNSVSLGFLVTDTGVGIAPVVQARLFKPFAQGDVGTAGHFGGTGLGLVIAKAYVELMGGEIRLESTVNVGTRLHFTARFEKGEDTTPRADLRTIGDIRLLIVDDDRDARNLIERYAADWELSHESAADGAEALTKLRATAAAGQPFDCAIIDYRLPGLNGLELGLEIKKDPAISQTRLLMLTAYDEPGTAATARASGFTAYLTKPITQSHVYDQLVAMMANEAPVQAVPARKATANLEMDRRLRVLLAEDNAVNRRVAGRQLSLLGCDVVTVNNGEEAAEAIERESFDVVLMDCNMPVMDGLTATRRIRERELAVARSKVPIVAMTANASEEDRERCLVAGMDDYISKPVLVETLRAALLRVSPRR